MLAVFWSTASHFVLGVPFDMVSRAATEDPEAEQDLVDMVRVHSNRLIYITETSGTWLTGFIFFMITGFLVLGFFYDVEFAQALFLIATPMSLVFALSVRNAKRIRGLAGAELRKRLRLHRLAVQVIGMLSILVTSMWGMYVNISTGVLGG